MRKVSEKKLRREWKRAIKGIPQHERKNTDENGRPISIIYDGESGRPTFKYRHPNFPLAISIVSLILVVGKPILLDMLQWLQKVLFR